MHKTLIAAAVTLLSAGPALALGCSEGSHFADAEVYPSKTMGRLTTATQYAWDGGTGIVRTCNLTTENGDLAGTWQLFSGEIDVAHGGICIALTNSDGRSWYSCAAPDAVARASAARPGTPGFALTFRDWQTEVAAFRR